MKYIKLYEDFVNESVNEKKVDPAEIEKDIVEIAKKKYEVSRIKGTNRTDDDPEQQKLRYQAALLSHKGDSAAAEKIKDKIEDRYEAQRAKYLKLDDEVKKLKEKFDEKFGNYPGIAKANKARSAAEYTASYQADLENYTELIKTYKELATKAGKEISDAKKEDYIDSAVAAKTAVDLSKGKLEEVHVLYKKALEELKNGGEEKEKGGEEMTAAELAEYVWKNWKKITGLKASARNEEGDFPEEVQELMKKHNIDYGDFSDAWSDEAEANSSR